MKTQFFLGANSADGFYSLYDNFCRNGRDFLYLIKGGPGCGKSGFMRKMADRAEALGYDVEYILCSGDPDSLDAIYIPALELGFADATAPHVIEPGLFAVNSCYVNLGEFCSATDNIKISQLTEKYKLMYKNAYRFLSAAFSIKNITKNDVISEKEAEKIRKRAYFDIKRELGIKRKIKSSSFMQHRFLSAISCNGILHLTETVKKLCKRIYVIDNCFESGKIYLNEIKKQAIIAGAETILCYDPLCPSELEAVMLPKLSTGFVSSSVADEKAAFKRTRLRKISALCGKTEEKLIMQQYSQLLKSAVYYLKKAKKFHDALELEYRPLINFEALNEFTERFANEHIN